MTIPLTIIIPARHEEEATGKTIMELKRNIKTRHKIIVVNDSDPKDRTKDIVRKFINKNKLKNVSLVSRSNNPAPSFASAIVLGFKNTKTDFVLPVMADLCDNPKDIDKMFKKIQEGWDIVCGSRYMKGGKKIGGPLFQSICSQLVCLTLHYLTRIPTRDVSNAFKLYRMSTLKNTLIDGRSGVEASMAITLQAYFQNAKIVDIPTRWIGRTVGQSKFKIIERTPKYSRIYLWALENTLRKLFGLKNKRFWGKRF